MCALADAIAGVLAEQVEELTRSSRSTTERLVDIVMAAPPASAEAHGRAVDIVWALSGSAVFRRLVDSCGWPAQTYEDWLADEIERAVRGAMEG